MISSVLSSSLASTRTREPRVLFVGNFLSRGGGRRAICEELGERLVGSGWSVLLTSSVLSRLPRLADMLRTLISARRRYDVAHVDVFSGGGFLWAEAVTLALGMLHKPYILTLRGGGLPEFALRWPGRVRSLLTRAAVVTAPSSYLQKGLSAHRQDIQLLPNAIEVSRYPFQARAVPRPNLVWLRAFHEMYQPTLGPEVVARLRNEFPDIRLTMIGPDKGDGSLERTRRAAIALGVEDRIDFAGGVTKAAVPAWLSRGDVFLNTTGVDNVPVSVIEALACGLCVVSTDAGGLPDLLDDGQDALLAPTGNAESLAGAVRRVLTEPGLANRLSRNGRTKAEAMDWSVVMPEWERLLEKAAGIP